MLFAGIVTLERRVGSVTPLHQPEAHLKETVGPPQPNPRSGQGDSRDIHTRPSFWWAQTWQVQPERSLVWPGGRLGDPPPGKGQTTREQMHLTPATQNPPAAAAVGRVRLRATTAEKPAGEQGRARPPGAGSTHRRPEGGGPFHSRRGQRTEPGAKKEEPWGPCEPRCPRRDERRLEPSTREGDCKRGRPPSSRRRSGLERGRPPTRPVHATAPRPAP